MNRTQFENLRVYLLAEKLADAIWPIASQWHNFGRDTLGKQLVRAVDSIGANIAEGAGQGSFAANRHFVKIARGSLNETQHWLRRAYQRRLLTAEQVEHLRITVDSLGPQLNAYLKSIGAKAAALPMQPPSMTSLLRTTDH